MLLLELLLENKEVLEKVSNHLHNRGWTFYKGESILKYIPHETEDRIFIYDDKTVRFGNLVSARFCKPKYAIRVNKEKIEGLTSSEYEKWIKEIEKSILEGMSI